MTAHVPVRTCIGCRAARPRPELVRLALAGGSVAVDREGSLGGRGGYICRATAPACIHQAVRRRAFDRALRTRAAGIDENHLLRALGAAQTSTEEDPPSPR